MTAQSILYTGPIVKRPDAISDGMKRYFSGVPCKRGHIDQRDVKTCVCIECANISRNEYNERFPNARSEAAEKYRKSDKGKAAQRRASKKYRSTTSGKISSHKGSSASRVLDGIVKKSIAKIGYNQDGFEEHIERQFKDGMTWDNYGDAWEIDHIIPIKWYLDNGETDPSIINALTNLRPLSVEENRAKSGNRTILI